MPPAAAPALLQRIKRRLIRWAFLAAGFSALGAFLLHEHANRVVRAAVETLGSRMTDTPVVVGSVRSDLLRGRLRLYKLRVRNPDGFRIQNAFMAERVDMRIDWSSLLGDEIRISELTVIRPVAVFEGKLAGSNIRKLQAAVDDFLGPGETTRMRVSRFRSREGKVVVGGKLFLGLKGAAVSMPDLDMKDVGIGSASWKDTVAQMTGSLSDSIEKTAAEATDSVGKAGQAAQKTLQSLLPQ